jgi:hypothetical protein
MTDIINIGKRLPQQTRKSIGERFAPDGAESYCIAVEAAPAGDAHERNLAGALRQLWRRRWLVALGTLAGVAIAAAVLWCIPPRYIAEVVAIGIPSPAFRWMAWAILGQASGAYVGPTCWAVLFFAGAAAVLHQRNETQDGRRFVLHPEPRPDYHS